MIRGSDPSPGAGSTYKGDGIRLFKASKYLQEGGPTPGTVTDITEETFSVQALGGCVRVGRVQPRGSAKIMAPEWMSLGGGGGGVYFCICHALRGIILVAMGFLELIFFVFCWRI